MVAAVYRGANDVRLEEVQVPEIGPGEILVQVHTCGICGTDLKKIAAGALSAPRIFGHETAGTIAAVGDGVLDFAVGERVVVFHHIPCRSCYYCERKVFAQCQLYKKIGCTAGFEPSGGGFAEYVRVFDWIVAGGGVVRIPDSVSFEEASFVEPVNTCMKAIAVLDLQAADTVLVIGQGPIGILLGVLARRAGARVLNSDLLPERLRIAAGFGLAETPEANGSMSSMVRDRTHGRGADAVIVAAPGNALISSALDACRPGGRVMLFAQTMRGEAVFDPASICVDEKTLLGSYSASVDLQQQSADFVFSRAVNLETLISHRLPLSRVREALQLAAAPRADTMKIVLQPDKKMEELSA
jgi:L-iditol 2-dehydrogenase